MIFATTLVLGHMLLSDVKATVRLLSGPFKVAEEANGKVLLSLEPERLLHGFYVTAGLPTKGPKYGGWESMGIAGHSLGHYLSACSHQFVATGNEMYRERVRLILRELEACQANRADGYIGAIPDGDRIWSEVRRGEIRSQGFDLNDGWVPWYTQHKIFAGLIDALQVANCPEALPILTKFADWAIDVTSKLNPEQWQKMLACEHGGMNESLAELYVITKEPKYLELARKFHHDAVLNPLKRGEDRLAGLHSNTQIPKLIGLARLYEIEQKPEDRRAAEFFWDRIVNHRTFTMGGNSNHEHLGPADQLNNALSTNSSETCNTYNMLKLTKHLDAWQPKASWYDFYERAVFNHILGSQRSSDGMYAYYMPLQPKATRPYSTLEDSFWCCVGTGMENHARYREGIYAHDNGELRVNLFISSTMNLNGHEVIRLDTDFPNSGRVKLRATNAAGLIKIRKPSWVTKDPPFKLNGTMVRIKPSSDGYYVIPSTAEVSIIEWEWPIQLRTEAMPDNPNRLSILYGPIVLAAVHPKTSKVDSVLVPGKSGVSSWLKRVTGKELRFKSQGVLRPSDLTFVPFYATATETYTTYFDRFSAAEWKQREEQYRREEALRIAEEKATVDELRPGEMQSERDHELKGERTEVGEHMGRKWRHAVNGWFEFRMKVEPSGANTLVLDLWSGDVGRQYDISVDGQVIATQSYPPTSRAEFIKVRHLIPESLTKGKQSVIIRLSAKSGSVAGGIFGARIVKLDPK